MCSPPLDTVGPPLAIAFSFVCRGSICIDLIFLLSFWIPLPSIVDAFRRGIPRSLQYIWAARNISDISIPHDIFSPLYSQNIQKESTLHLVLRLRGGGKKRKKKVYTKPKKSKHKHTTVKLRVLKLYKVSDDGKVSWSSLTLRTHVSLLPTIVEVICCLSWAFDGSL